MTDLKNLGKHPSGPMSGTKAASWGSVNIPEKTSEYPTTHQIVKEHRMHGIFYLIGLIVVVLVILNVVF